MMRRNGYPEKRSLHILRYYPTICLEGLRKTTKPTKLVGIPAEIPIRHKRYRLRSVSSVRELK
jgi:hypothetical protein